MVLTKGNEYFSLCAHAMLQTCILCGSWDSYFLCMSYFNKYAYPPVAPELMYFGKPQRYVTMLLVGPPLADRCEESEPKK